MTPHAKAEPLADVTMIARRILNLSLPVLLALSCHAAMGATTGGCPDWRVSKRLRGHASYYSDALAGHRTASGEPYSPAAFTAAHRSLPFGTWLRVHRLDGNNETVCVRVNDRGPFAGKSRIIDLSRAAAEALHMMRVGVAAVEVAVLKEE